MESYIILDICIHMHGYTHSYKIDIFHSVYHPLDEGNLICFDFGAVMDICIEVFVRNYVSFLLGVFLSAELQGDMVTLCLTF